MLTELRRESKSVSYNEIKESFEKIKEVNGNIVDYEELTKLLLVRMGLKNMVEMMPNDIREELEFVMTDVYAEEDYRIEFNKLVLKEIETHHNDKPNVKGKWDYDTENNILDVEIISAGGLCVNHIAFEFHSDDFEDNKRIVKEERNYYMNSNGYL